MTIQPTSTAKRKEWAEPKLEQLTVDLTAIELQQSGNTDFRGVGSIS